MLKSHAPTSKVTFLNTAATTLHSCNTTTTANPVFAGILLLDILKTMELRLQKRGFLVDCATQGIHPLWFVAENERNTFLWRRGLSLEDCGNFEFWVDIQRLADKRRQQLELLRDGFSVNNLPWGLELLDENNVEVELDYIANFINITEKIQKHVYALSKAGLQLFEELQPGLKPRQVIVLPSPTANSV